MLVGGHGGGEEGIGFHAPEHDILEQVAPEHDMPEQETIDSLRA